MSEANVSDSDLRVATDIATLVNKRNRLTAPVAAAAVAKQLLRQYFYMYDAQSAKMAVAVRCRKTSWYSHEVSYLVVAEEFERRGYGQRALQCAEDMARNRGARVLTCTIAADNDKSIRLFTHAGFVKTGSFLNRASDRSVGVFHKFI